MAEPLISVIMPVYNSEKHLDASVESVVAQTYNSWELIIVDDASSDGSVLLLEKYAQKDSRISLYKNDINLGVSATRNKAISYANGDWVAFLDSDDIWFPKKLELQIKVCNSKNKLCYAGALIIDSKGNETGRHISVPTQITRAELLKGNVIITSTAVVHKSVVSNFPMVQDNGIHEDFVLWSQILSVCDHAVGVCLPLAKYRLTDGSKSRNKLKSSMMTWKSYRFIGLSFGDSLRCFISYICHGARRYWL